MRSLKLLNKKYLLVFLFSIFFGSTTYSQEPVDIWSIEEKKTIEASSAIKNSEEQKAQQNSVYEMQSQKNNEFKRFLSTSEHNCKCAQLFLSTIVIERPVHFSTVFSRVLLASRGW